MRLRKNMKRTAAAVLALSMAVSAVAAPASAAYICDVSQGNVEIFVDESGNKSIKVGGEKVEKSEDESDDIIITGDNTGDNTKPTESQNAEEENTSEVEKSGETKTEGKTQNSAAEGENEGDTFLCRFRGSIRKLFFQSSTLRTFEPSMCAGCT